MPMTSHPPPSDRSHVRRVPDRGHYDAATVHEIIDAAYFCHVAFVDNAGVHCIPTACWREGRYLYVHGSNGSRMLRVLSAGAEACVTITHLDGLVLARSAFHHSMNYRSVVVHGRFECVTQEEKASALDYFLNHLAPGRHLEVRPGDVRELAATTVLRMPLTEASAKIRAGGPKDDATDMEIDVWAGVLPLTLKAGPPQPDGNIVREAPAYGQAWRKPR